MKVTVKQLTDKLKLCSSGISQLDSYVCKARIPTLITLQDVFLAILDAGTVRNKAKVIKLFEIKNKAVKVSELSDVLTDHAKFCIEDFIDEKDNADTAEVEVNVELAKHFIRSFDSFDSIEHVASKSSKQTVVAALRYLGVDELILQKENKTELDLRLASVASGLLSLERQAILLVQLVEALFQKKTRK